MCWSDENKKKLYEFYTPIDSQTKCFCLLFDIELFRCLLHVFSWSSTSPLNRTYIVHTHAIFDSIHWMEMMICRNSRAAASSNDGDGGGSTHTTPELHIWYVYILRTIEQSAISAIFTPIHSNETENEREREKTSILIRDWIEITIEAEML